MRRFAHHFPRRYGIWIVDVPAADALYRSSTKAQATTTHTSASRYTPTFSGHLVSWHQRMRKDAVAGIRQDG